MTPDIPDPLAVAAVVGRHAWRFVDEYDLQEGLAEVLAECWPVRREVRLSAHDRPDLLVGDDPGVVVEVKVAGRHDAVVRQVERYAAHDRVSGVVLVTASRRHHLPALVGGKPAAVVVVAQR